MLKNIDYPESNEYRSATNNEPISFFLEALENSISFDLLLGYFSSSAINVLSLGFANFIHRGGKMRIIANHILSSKDKSAVIRGNEVHEDSFSYGENDYQEIFQSLDEYGVHFFNCIAWLIASKRIEIKVIKPKDSKGISHYKSGVFCDENGDKVKFKSSCNFTSYGLLENLEELEVKQLWNSSSDQSAILEQEKYFNKIFDNEADFVRYIPIEEIEEAILKKFGGREIDELLIDEDRLLSKREKIFQNEKTKKILERLQEQIITSLNEPRFPYAEPRKYQIQAFENWKNKNYKGIFAMATGTGKTITSLNCLLNEYIKSGSYKAIILVPTIALVNQWKKECRKFNFKNIITVSSKEKWNNKLSFFNTANRFINTSFIVIVTYASFVRSKFQGHLKEFPNDTLLIADEMHNMGASSVLKSLEGFRLQKRIGLSATPNRKFDLIGNSGIEAFFDDTFPYTFSYSMKKAINSKPPSLCSYYYHPYSVMLTADEQKMYVKISKQLFRYIDQKTGRYKDCKEVEELLLKRKRIIHKAENKKEIFKEILEHEFQKKKNLKFTLVYVPEGKVPDYNNFNDDYKEDEEEIKLISEYTRIISRIDDSVMVRQYTSKTKDRDKVIKDFGDGKIHVLSSMKCLDEGVDVPRSELAIFCASTGNSRQFIQRRGRVLRTHDDKAFAVIYDLVVVPAIEVNGKTYEIERNLFKKELERVVDFSELSMNKTDTYEEFKESLDYYNLNLNDFKTD